MSFFSNANAQTFLTNCLQSSTKNLQNPSQGKLQLFCRQKRAQHIIELMVIMFCSSVYSINHKEMEMDYINEIGKFSYHLFIYFGQRVILYNSFLRHHLIILPSLQLNSIFSCSLFFSLLIFFYCFLKEYPPLFFLYIVRF